MREVPRLRLQPGAGQQLEGQESQQHHAARDQAGVLLPGGGRSVRQADGGNAGGNDEVPVRTAGTDQARFCRVGLRDVPRRNGGLRPSLHSGGDRLLLQRDQKEEEVHQRPARWCRLRQPCLSRTGDQVLRERRGERSTPREVQRA